MRASSSFKRASKIMSALSILALLQVASVDSALAWGAGGGGGPASPGSKDNSTNDKQPKKLSEADQEKLRKAKDMIKRLRADLRFSSAQTIKDFAYRWSDISGMMSDLSVYKGNPEYDAVNKIWQQMVNSPGPDRSATPANSPLF